MLSLFQKKPPLAEEATHWLFETYAWALRNFGQDVFRDETILVTPTPAHFPGRASSVEDMAQLMFDRVQHYAGTRHWPVRLIDARLMEDMVPPRLPELDAVRGDNAKLPLPLAQPLIVPFNPHQINKPEALIASYAHVLAYYLGTTSREPPPGGEEYWPQATELLGVFMGFGIMFVNTAYTFRGGCGSCYNPLAERSAILNQDEITYALALFCALKGIDAREVLPHLKSYLRPVFKKCLADVERRSDKLAELKSLISKSRMALGSPDNQPDS